MDVTLDTSVLLAVVCGEASRSQAIALTEGHSLVAPASLHWEFGNALSAMLKRQRITARQAEACIRAYHGIPIRRVEVELSQAVALAGRRRVYAYDAYMLVCARQTASPLLTLDEALKVHARELDIETLEIHA